MSAPSNHIPSTPWSYRLARGLARLWFNLYFRKIRLLHAEVISEFGLPVLVVTHPASFLDSVILIAAFERPLRCMIGRDLVRRPLRRLAARVFQMIPVEPEGEGPRSAATLAVGALEQGAAVAIFAEPFPPPAAGRHGSTRAAALLALEAESQLEGPVEIYPVNLFLPVGRSQSGELLIYVDAPLIPREYLSRFGGDVEQSARALTLDLDRAAHDNAFALEPARLRQLFGDLEETLRGHWADAWAARRQWKQSAEEFQLSGFVREWAEGANFLNPGRLVELGVLLDDYRERHRRWSLAKLEVETAGEWIKSPLARFAASAETAVGLAPALYGALNHLLAALALAAARLLKHREGREAKSEWLARGLLLILCYAFQIFLCDRRLGRAAAGYYALSLPLAGAYLWRYAWLVRRRTRLLFLARLSRARAGRLRRMRTELARALRRQLDAHAEALALPH